MVLLFVSFFFFPYYLMSKISQIYFSKILTTLVKITLPKKKHSDGGGKKKTKCTSNVLESCLPNSYYLHIELLVHSR
jgi:hypothetical protein